MKRRLSAVSAWVLLAGGLVVIATNVALSASPDPSPMFSAYASGTAVHADVLQTGPLNNGLQLVGAEAAFSGAALHNGGAPTSQIVNEMSQEVQPNLPGAPPDLSGKISYGMGDGLAVNIGQNVPVVPPPTIPLTVPARVSDGHTPDGVQTKELATIPGAPLVYADLLRGQAEATKDTTACGDNPFGQGLGRVANVQLLDTGATLPDKQLGAPVVSVASTQPDRGAVQSRSTTQLVPLGDHKGVTSEVRETFAPVTLFKNTPMQVTIELLGEWVLSTTVGGTPGSASFHYGPEPVPPTTPILRIIQGYPNPKPTNVLTFDDFTKGGLPQHLIPGNPLIDVWLNESPRTIGSSNDANPPGPALAGNGTSASAAVDVVRAKVLQDTLPGAGGHLADVRIGHMESSVSVAGGGIPCPVPTTVPPTTAPPTTAAPTTTAPATPCVGWATGTDVHADALQTGLPPTGMQVLNAEVAFSGASARTSGNSPQLVNEMQQEVQPALPFTGTPAQPKLGGSLAYGRGSGLEVGLGQTLPANAPTIPVNKVALSAPPNQEETADPANVPAAPLISASLLRGHAKVSSDGSELKNPSGEGDGYAADVSLLDTGASMVNPLPTPLISTSSNTPDRATVSSKSTSKLVPFGDHFGIVSEVRETIAPVTLFKNTPNQTTIEVLGEWVLTVTANGTGATAIHYGPDPTVTAPTTPILRISQGWPIVTSKNVITFQDFTSQGLPQHLIPATPLLDIWVADNPRTIGSDNAANPPLAVPAANGTSASAAVDVVRVKVLQDTVPGAGGHVADVRVGHMEASARVPSGGCVLSTTPTTVTTVTPTSAPPTTLPPPPGCPPSCPPPPPLPPTPAPPAPAQPGQPPAPPVQPANPAQPANPGQPAQPSNPPPTVAGTQQVNPTNPVNPTNGAVQPAAAAAPQAQVLANTFTRPETPAATAVQANPTFTG